MVFDVPWRKFCIIRTVKSTSSIAKHFIVFLQHSTSVWRDMDRCQGRIHRFPRWITAGRGGDYRKSTLLDAYWDDSCCWVHYILWNSVRPWGEASGDGQTLQVCLKSSTKLSVTCCVRANGFPNHLWFNLISWGPFLKHDHPHKNICAKISADSRKALSIF